MQTAVKLHLLLRPHLFLSCYHTQQAPQAGSTSRPATVSTVPILLSRNLDPEFQSCCHHVTQCNGIGLPSRMSQSCCQQQRSRGLDQSASTQSRSQRQRRCQGSRYSMQHTLQQVNKSWSGMAGMPHCFEAVSWPASNRAGWDSCQPCQNMTWCCRPAGENTSN